MPPVRTLAPALALLLVSSCVLIEGGKLQVDHPERHTESGAELFSLDRRIAYRDRRLGEILVPADADFRTDLFVLSNLSMDSLDYAGPRINEGSKGVLLGLGAPRRKLPETFVGTPDFGIASFCAPN